MHSRQKRDHITKQVRDRVKKLFGGKCSYCGQVCKIIYIDHVVPYSSNIDFPNRETNLLPSCFSCNSMKHNYSLEQFRKEIEQQVERARKYSVNFRIAERYGQLAETKSPIVFYFERMK